MCSSRGTGLLQYWELWGRTKAKGQEWGTLSDIGKRPNMCGFIFSVNLTSLDEGWSGMERRPKNFAYLWHSKRHFICWTLKRGVNQDIIETPGIEENKDRCYGEAGYLLATPDIEIFANRREGNWGVRRVRLASASLIQSKYCAVATHTRARCHQVPYDVWLLPSYQICSYSWCIK